MTFVSTVVAAFNQEKALVGAFSVIVKTGFGTDGSICGTNHYSLFKVFAELIEDLPRNVGAAEAHYLCGY